MIGWMAMELIPLLYGAAYLVHSVRRRRIGQAIAVGAALLVTLAAVGVLLWQFYRMP